MNVLQNKTKDIVISVSVKISQLSQKLGTWNHIHQFCVFNGISLILKWKKMPRIILTSDNVIFQWHLFRSDFSFHISSTKFSSPLKIINKENNNFKK